MKAVLSVLAMLTVAPLVAATTLVCWDPQRWAGSLNPLAIIEMAIFGVFSAPLWPTYVPALIVTPLLMRWISRHPAFHRSPLPIVLGHSVVVGSVAGACVMIRLVLMVLRDSSGYSEALACASAGAISGGLTLALICLLYRYEERRAEPSASPNGGPATPLGNSGVEKGPPSVS